MWERIRSMLVKEFIQGLRDPRMRMVLFGVPVMQLFVFGYAANTDVRHIATAVYDLDNTVASRDLLSRFEQSGYFDVVEYLSSEAQTQDLLDHGRVRVVIRLNKGLEEDLRAGRTAHVQLILDGADSSTGSIVLSYANRIASRFTEQTREERWRHLRGSVPLPGQVELQTRAWFNENLESRNFYVPGVIATLVTLISLILTSMAVVREKEIGTMEQIMVTPIRPIEFILGKTLPFALISLFDVILITAVGVFWFEIPIRGHLAWLFLGAVLFLLSTLGVGLLISTVSRTQQQALMGTFFFFMPALLLSGFMFPIANMPTVVQWLTYLNPLRYFLVIIRGVFLKGVGLDVLWPHMAALAIIGCLTLWIASRRFQKTMA
jgi:ABC-2 type transport system permease protein